MLRWLGTGGGVKVGSLGIADQIMLSATNLLVGLVLARELEAVAFGAYVIAFAVSLAGSSVQVSLVTDPLVVLGAPRSGEEQSRHFAALMQVQILVSLAVGATVGLAAWSLHMAWGSSSQLPLALAGVAAATVPGQLQTFVRAVFFARLRPAAVFRSDLVFCVLRLTGITVLFATGLLSPFTTILIGGAAALVATVTALPSCSDLLAARRVGLGDAWRANWSYGRWLLATSGAYWCSGQAPTLIAAGLLTPVAAAVIKACQYLVTPVNVALTGLDTVLASLASRSRASEGDESFRRFLRFVAIWSGGGVALYALFMLPAAPWIIGVMYSGRYDGYVAVVTVLLIDAILSAITRAPLLHLKVTGDTRGIFIGYLWAALAGVACLATLAPTLGVLGAAIAAPASSATLLASLALTIRSRRTTIPTVHFRAAVPEP